VVENRKPHRRGHLARLFSKTNAIISFAASIVGLSILWNTTTRTWLSAGLEWMVGPGIAFSLGTLSLMCLALALLLSSSNQRLRMAAGENQQQQAMLEKLREQQATKETDRALLKELVTDLSAESIKFMKDFDFANSFEWSSVAPVSNFALMWKDARHEFLDEEIEAMKRVLVERAGAVADAIALNTSVQWHGRSAVAEASKLDTPHGYREHAEEIRELNERADAFIQAHEDFIRTARKRLAT
jgi:hypothetical protein